MSWSRCLSSLSETWREQHSKLSELVQALETRTSNLGDELEAQVASHGARLSGGMSRQMDFRRQNLRSDIVEGLRFVWNHGFLRGLALVATRGTLTETKDQLEERHTRDRLEAHEAGTLRVRVYSDWAPLGAARFYNLTRHGFYDGTRFFRVLPGFVAQFGASGDPAVDQVWADQALPDDPQRVRNTGGTLSFASRGPDTRATQLFFTYRSNEMLDAQGFTPIGRVVEGMDVLFRLNSDYGETAPRGTGPDWGCILSNGNSYLARRFPRLDSIRELRIID